MRQQPRRARVEARAVRAVAADVEERRRVGRAGSSRCAAAPTRPPESARARAPTPRCAPPSAGSRDSRRRRRVTSMTHAGPTKRRGGIVSHALSGRSLPVIQCTGASKCVPVCSPKRSVFQYHAGPLSSYFEMTSMVTPGDAANIGGRPITGVVGPSGCVRSTTRERAGAPARRRLREQRRGLTASDRGTSIALGISLTPSDDPVDLLADAPIDRPASASTKSRPAR